MPKLTMKAARINVGLTQEEAAIKLGVSKKTLGRWENGETYPTPPQIEAICNLYGVTYDNIKFF